MKHCQLKYVDENTRTCVRCGRIVESTEKPYRIKVDCGNGLGDKVARIIHKTGVKQKKGCGCEKRRKALNEAGAALGRILGR